MRGRCGDDLEESGYKTEAVVNEVKGLRQTNPDRIIDNVKSLQCLGPV